MVVRVPVTWSYFHFPFEFWDSKLMDWVPEVRDLAFISTDHFIQNQFGARILMCG